MSKEKLGDYIEEFSVKNKDNQPYKVYSVTNSDGFCTEYFNKDVSSKDKSTYKIVPRGYFAYNPSRINVGSIDFQKYEDNVIVSPLYTVFKLSKKVDPNYLSYFFKSNYAKQLIDSSISGSVRFNLKISTLADFNLNIYPFYEQISIVNKLNIINNLIKKENQKIAFYDELIKSRFIELFMDENTDKFPLKKWKDVVEIKHGRDYKKNIVNSGGFPVYGSGGFMGVYVNNYLVKENSIIIGRKGTIDKPIYVKEKYWNVDTAFGIEVNEFVLNPIYFFVRSKLYDLKSMSTSTTIPSMTQATLQNINIGIPPLQLQNEFAAFVNLIDKSKFIVQKRIELYKELLDKKMDEYFN